MADSTKRVHCCCGHIELELAGAPLTELFCHCKDCQSVHGAAYTPAAMYRKDDVKLVRGSPIRWKLRTTQRWACPDCGARLLSEGTSEVWGVNPYMPGYGRFAPRMHINCESAVLPVIDDLPHYRTVPSAFGGSDERVHW